MRYFFYEFKRRIPILVALTLAALAVTFAFALSGENEWGSRPIDQYRIREIFLSTTAAQTASLCIIAIGLPIYLFAPLSSKAGVDLYYSLPISRAKLYVVKLLVGISYIFISYFIFYWISSVVLLRRLPEGNIGMYIANFSVNFLLSLFLFGFSSFAFTRGKSVFDGVVNIGLSLFMLFTAGQAICTFVFNRITYIEWQFYFFFIFEPNDFVTTLFQNGVLGRTMEYGALRIVAIALELCVGIMSYVGLFVGLNFDEAENVGNVTESYFSYKTALPALMFFGNVLLCESVGWNLFPNIILIVAGFFGYCIFRRTFKIKWFDYLALFISSGTGILICLIP